MTADTMVRSGRLTTLTAVPERGKVRTHLAFRYWQTPLCGGTITTAIVLGTYRWERIETRCTACARIADVLAPEHIPA